MKTPQQAESKNNLSAAAEKRTDDANKEIGKRLAELRKQIDGLASRVGSDPAVTEDVKKLQRAAQELADLLPGDGIHAPTGHVNPGPGGLPNPEPTGVQRAS